MRDCQPVGFVRGQEVFMGSWEEAFRFLVMFGGACVILVLALALFVWILYKLDKLG